jgi:hypothetical protein
MPFGRDLPADNLFRATAHKEAVARLRYLGRPARVLQPRLIQVEVHPVDRLDLEGHVAGQDIGNGAR